MTSASNVAMLKQANARMMMASRGWQTLARRLQEGGIYATPSALKVTFLENGLIGGDKIKSLMETAARNYDVPIIDAGHIINPNIAHKTNSGVMSRMMAGLGFKRYMGTSFPTMSLSPELHRSWMPFYNNAVLRQQQQGRIDWRGLFDDVTGNTMPGVKWTDEMLDEAPFNWNEVPGVTSTMAERLSAGGLLTPRHYDKAVRNIGDMADYHNQNLSVRKYNNLDNNIPAPSIRHYPVPDAEPAKFDYDLVKRSFVLAYTPTSMAKQASMRPFSRDAWDDNSNNHNNTGLDMAIGALAGGALPAASMARYELVDLPGMRRNIDRVIDRASRRGLIFATPQGYGRTNPLAAHIQAGDVVLQAHKNDPFLQSVAQKDFGTLSSAASGSPLSHVGVTGAHGNVIDPGNKNLDKKSRSALIRKFLSDRSQWNVSGLRDLRMTIKNREFKPARRSYLDIINNFGTSAFWDDEPVHSNASIIMTPKNPKGSPDRSMVDLKSTYYGKGGATQSGLRRLLLPVGSGKMDVHGKSNLKNGLFCSQGVCYSLGSRGVPTVDPSKSLPPDFLENAHLKLKGIGLNSRVMEEYADRIKDVRGEKAKLRKATQLLFSDLTRTAAKHRRILGGAVTGGMAGVGSLAGLLANKAVQYDPDDYVPEFMRRKALPL